MPTLNLLPMPLALVCLTVLAGCAEKSEAPPAPPNTLILGTLSSSQYDTALNRVRSIPPSSNMPTTLAGSYAGASKMILTGPSGAANGEMLANVALDVNWTDGQTENPWTGAATDFRGTVGGQAGEYAGTLTVTDAFGGGVRRVSTDIPLPTGGTVTTATGAMTAALTGDLTINGNTGRVIMNVGGNFLGQNQDAVQGSASSIFDANTGLGDHTGSGTFFIEKQ